MTRTRPCRTSSTRKAAITHSLVWFGAIWAACLFVGVGGCASRGGPVTMFGSAQPLNIANVLETAADEQQAALLAINEGLTLMDRPPSAIAAPGTETPGTDVTSSEWAEQSRRLVRRAETRVKAAQHATERAKTRTDDVLEQLRLIARRTANDELRKANLAKVEQDRAIAEPAVSALESANETFAPVLLALRDRAAFDRLRAGGPGIEVRPDTSEKEAPLLEAMRSKTAIALERVKAVRRAFGGAEAGTGSDVGSGAGVGAGAATLP
jgi:hypothetical protein